MDTDLVTRAQHGDKEAFATLAAARADRYPAVARRILRDLDLAEDATQQALLSIWRDLPSLRDPARFDAWSYRLLVRACYAEGGKSRHWTPNIRLLAADEPMETDGLSAVVDRDQLERARRPGCRRGDHDRVAWVRLLAEGQHRHPGAAWPNRITESDRYPRAFQRGQNVYRWEIPHRPATCVPRRGHDSRSRLDVRWLVRQWAGRSGGLLHA
jgi:DNA-directed RNA polymerase specialized sigma24 family protein